MFKPDNELRSLQLKCVEIVSFFDKFCRKNKIEYALCGGSAIGAYMYGGFIPWDDDVDVMMTRKNYNRFIRSWKKSKQNEYKLLHYSNSPESITLFGKLVDEKTTIVEKYKDLNEIVTGVFIDITVFDSSSGPIFNKIKRKLVRFCWLKNLSANGLLPKKKSHLPYWIRRMLNSFVNRVVQIHFLKTNYVQEYFANDGDADKIKYPKELFSEYIDTRFENVTLRILKNNYKYLCLAYNRKDFHIPEDQQIPHHFAYLNLDIPYKEYNRSRNTKETL